MQPQSKSVDGLIMAMAGSIVAVVVIALLCCCMHRCRKSRPYDERKMTRLEEEGFGALQRKSSQMALAPAMIVAGQQREFNPVVVPAGSDARP